MRVSHLSRLDESIAWKEGEEGGRSVEDSHPWHLPAQMVRPGVLAYLRYVRQPFYIYSAELALTSELISNNPAYGVISFLLCHRLRGILIRFLFAL